MEPRILNNFVLELLNIRPCSEKSREYEFYNPRNGWIFLSSTADIKNPGSLIVSVSNKAGRIVTLMHEQRGLTTLEAMHFLSMGKYRVKVKCEGHSRLQHLIVRAVPEIIYCKFGYDPHVREYGPYDWEFLRKYVLHSVNCIVGSGSESHKHFVEEWKRNGRKWIIECTVPGLRCEDITAEEAYEYWSKNIGFQDPLLDGIIADEFLSRDMKQYLAWIEAIKRLRENENLRNKVFYAYCGGDMYKTRLSTFFVKTLMKLGYKLAIEKYLSEQPTKEDAKRLLDSALVQTMKKWREIFPGVERHVIICLGYMNAPPESLNVDPSVNYKVFLDMQFNVLANDPAFKDIFGIMTYTSGYADEEIVRWIGKLYRHYCIEGRREMLSKDPYKLTHIENPDFEEGLRGWTIYPAEKGSISVKSLEGYSWLQGRYPRTRRGDTFLWMKRSAKGPNVVVQTIRNLKPGELYSLKMITADYQDLMNGRSVKQKHVISIELENVELIPEKCFQHLFANCYSHHLGPFNDKHRAWMNYHVRVFRAKAETAKLIISDWLSKDEPGGPIGQELILNFIEIQPYLPG